MKKIFGVILAITVIAFAIFFVWNSQRQHLPKTTEKITLAVYAGAYGFLPYIAEEFGFFEKNGVEVVFKEYNLGLEAAQALLRGEADIATAADFVLVSYYSDNPDLRTLASIAQSNTDEILARRDRGIRVPKDIKGKKIGVTPKTKGEFFLGRFLTYNGLVLQDVQTVPLSPKEIVEAISSGSIDAASVWEPNVYEAKKRMGDGLISWPGQSGQEFFYLCLAKEKWIQTHSEAVHAFLKALVEAEEFTEREGQKVRKFIGERLHYDPSFVDTIWPKNKFLVELPQALLIAMEDGARWRIDNKLTERTELPNFLEAIYFEGLEGVKPAAVTIIK